MRRIYLYNAGFVLFWLLMLAAWGYAKAIDQHGEGACSTFIRR